MRLDDVAELARPADRKIVLLVLDGLGGLPMEDDGPTELEAAATPHMDRLARDGGCGLHVPVAPGITPGSGPGHLALFGYDPLRYRIGRGVLEALGIDFDLRPGDVAARGNFCTVDSEGRVTDRRAGRISTEAAEPLARALDGIELEGVTALVRHVKEHRFLLVLRPERELGADLEDTDPGRTGQPPATPTARDEASEPTARLVSSWLERARPILSDSDTEANMAVLRGFSKRPDWPRFPDVFGMRALGGAAYPMYRGVARLVGMRAVVAGEEPDSLVEALERHGGEQDFVFLHYKAPDKAGEDGDFDRKVASLEAADATLPDLLEAAGPAVLLLTGDHSTPARMKSHSWHPVPFLIHGGPARPASAAGFGESACLRGPLGTVRGADLMRLAAARAGRLAKYGA